MATPSSPPDAGGERRRGRPRRRDRARDYAGTARLRRVAAAVLGSALLVRGLRKRSLRGALTALLGGWLLVRTVRTPAGYRRRLSPRTEFGGPTGGRGEAAAGVAVHRSVTVGKPVEEVYEAWRDPEVLSRVVGHVGEVTPVGDDRYRWSFHGPLGRERSWETRLVEAEPGERIRWETRPGASLPNEGSVRFRPAAGDRGTTVTLSIAFDPPGGDLGRAAVERLDVVPEAAVGRALRRFKSLVETGEIPTLEANPSARGPGDRL